VNVSETLEKASEGLGKLKKSKNKSHRLLVKPITDETKQKSKNKSHRLLVKPITDETKQKIKKSEETKMKNNQYFNAMQKEFDAMSYGEIYDSTKIGKIAAYGAWHEGNRQELDFPVLTRFLREDDISDFLGTIEEAGFKKFGFFSAEKAVETITDFLKAGWKLTGTFEFDAGLHETVIANGVVFEK
jgi:hypothetical protein